MSLRLTALGEGVTDVPAVPANYLVRSTHSRWLQGLDELTFRGRLHVLRRVLLWLL